jgi:hypothetical protein
LSIVQGAALIIGEVVTLVVRDEVDNLPSTVRVSRTLRSVHATRRSPSSC